jgi:hypothetical protein
MNIDTQPTDSVLRVVVNASSVQTQVSRCAKGLQLSLA